MEYIIKLLGLVSKFMQFLIIITEYQLVTNNFKFVANMVSSGK